MSLRFPAQTGEQIVPRRAKRLRRRRVALAAVLFVGAVLTVGIANQAQATEKCEGCYDGKTPGNKLTIEPGDCGCLRVRAHNLPAGVTVSVQAGGKSASFTTNSHGNGQVYLTGLPGGTTTVHASGGGASKTKTVHVKPCPKHEQPPPVTTPPTTSPPPTTTPPPVKEQPPVVDTPDQPKPIHGTATSKKRTEPNPDDSIPVLKQPQPSAELNQLPFTGPREDMQRAMALGSVLLLAAGSLMVRTARRKEEEQG